MKKIKKIKIKLNGKVRLLPEKTNLSKLVKILKIPIKNIRPMTMLIPPYIPANSEYPIGDITDKPTAS